jgi:hypothetical protein
MTEYVLAVKGTAALSAAEIQSISAVLHDRMTESVLLDRAASHEFVCPP